MKQTLILFLFLCFINLNAQTEKKYLVLSDFGYNYIHKDATDLYYSGQSSIYGEITREVTLNLSIARKFKSNFYYGIGFRYHNSKKVSNPDGDIPKNSNNTGYASYIITYQATTIDKSSSPYLFVEYFTHLTNWLTFSIDLYSKYNFTNVVTNQKLQKVNTTLFDSISPGHGDVGGFLIIDHANSEKKIQSLHIGLQPSFRFAVFKNMGISFSFGQIEYNTKIKDSRRTDTDQMTKSFSMGFSPANWLLGFYIRL
ncbi:MAG: hypothetical protein COW63_14815 [Bacteroidetes bacterium CG18_big_fil_WC_8_21_14_2_50_41_14]|nr:MAG: hypothetical protein COW63_14815 [Bacteroidetes bacterium CG18_big_fil_WC_8_21_14_2_50_41_14]PJB55456.1 MAG: hypothetical protein CO098_16290 [Bacteroidetes bacterium CG_4_9_14_3_um_filter_41_19]